MSLTSQIDGVTQLFTLLEEVGENYGVLYNGKKLSDEQFSIVDTTLITNFIPDVEDKLVIDYIVVDPSDLNTMRINAIDLRPQIDGSTLLFTIDSNLEINKYFHRLYYNGIFQQEGVDYRLENDRVIMFGTPPKRGDKLFIEYIEEVNAKKEIGGGEDIIREDEYHIVLEDMFRLVVEGKKQSGQCCCCNKVHITMPLTIDQIVQQINDYYPDGIVKADKNGLNQVYLVSKTKGAAAFIKVSGKAAPIIFGDAESAQGENPKQKEIDYQQLIDFIKRGLGFPLVPVELTKDQLDDIVREGFNLYNKYRNAEEQLITVQLSGNEIDGWDIPPIVGDQKNIIDIYFKPRIPFTIFNSTGFESFVFTQQLFQQYNQQNFLASGFLSDYYILNMFVQDMDMILGSKPTWNILNGKIQIYPKMARFTQVAIKYKSKLTMEQALADPIMIQKWCIGKARTILGSIRATFGGTLQAGESTLQMNGSDMITTGNEEMKEAITEMKGEREPLGFVFG